MNWSIYAGSELIERGDDATRTVYDGEGNALRAYTEAENAAADQGTFTYASPLILGNGWY